MAFENITVQPIIVPVETFSENPVGSDGRTGWLFFQELKVPSICYVNWVSLYIQYINITEPINPLNMWNVSIYNATSSFPDLSPAPGEMIPGSSVAIDPRYSNTGTLYDYLGHWENITLGNVLLDSSNTLYQGGYYHFFVAVLMPGIGGHLWWFSNDTSGLGDNYGKAYYSPTIPGTSQRLGTVEIMRADLTCITKLYPMSSPGPSDIGLTVNNEPVANAGSRRGIYTTAEPINPVNDIVTYKIDSAWGNYPGGSFECDASLNYTVRDPIVPQVEARPYSSNSSVTWTATYTFSQAEIKGQATATISVIIPLSWSTIALYNVTGATPVQVVGLTTLSPTGKYWTFTVHDITPGTWRLVANSPVLALATSLNIASGTIDISESITGTASMVNGPNGRIVSSRSDYEGGISSLSMQSGEANTTLTNTVTNLDGKGIRFFNDTGFNLEYLYEKIYALNEVTDNFTVNCSLDLWVDLPDEFRISDIHDLELVLDHQSFDDSWWFGNVTGAAMPGNPSPQWILDPGMTYGEVFEALMETDLNVIHLNFTYDNAPGEKHYADVYFNYSLDMFNQLAVPRDAITSLTFDVVTNFTAATNHQVLFIRNQTSPTKEWVQMSNLVKKPAMLWFLHEHWTSDGESAIQNLTQFISPTDNMVEMFIRTYNDTAITVGPSVRHHYFADQALLNFTYSNSFKRFDMTVYNWTGANYSPTILTFYPTSLKSTTVLSLGTAFSNNFNGLIDPATGKVRIRIGAEATTPLVNEVWWDLDRVMLNVTFTSFSRCTWNQSIYTSGNVDLYDMTQETLYDSPNNNFTVDLRLLDATSVSGAYRYRMAWMNLTDIAITYQNFTINPLGTLMSFYSTNVYNDTGTGRWRMASLSAPYVNDTTKSIDILVTDNAYGNPLDGGIITTNWSGAYDFRDLYEYYGSISTYKGLYRIFINTTGMDPTGSNPIDVCVNFSKAFYFGSSITLLVDIKPLPVSIIPGQLALTVFEDQAFDLGVTILDSFHQVPLTSISMSWNIVGVPAAHGTFNHLISGVYTCRIELQPLNLPPNNYVMHINASAVGVENASYSLNLTITPQVAVRLVLTSLVSVTRVQAGDPLSLEASLSYLVNSTAIEGETVTFYIQAQLRGGGIQSLPLVAITDAQGKAKLNIFPGETWASFVYHASFESDDPALQPASTSSSQSIQVLNLQDNIVVFFLDNMYYMIGVVAAFIVIGVIRRSNSMKKRRIWRADADKIRDVVKIQHLMVIIKNSGACVVNRAYSQMQLDGDLISGFLTAIASFGKEVGGDRGVPSKASGEAIVFDYQNFKILLQEGSQVRLALILSGPPTAGLKDRAKRFVDRFEATYDLQNWRGNLDVFNGVDTYIEEAFEITLIYPLVVNPKKTKKDIKSGLGKALYEVGEAVQKEKQAFYLATLLTYAQAGRKESQDQVLGEIYQLKKQGFLTFYNPQAAQGPLLNP